MFKISEVSKNGRIVHRLNIPKSVAGKPQRKFFPTLEAARAYRKLLLEDVRQHGGSLATLNTEARAALARWLKDFSLRELDDLFTLALKQRTQVSMPFKEGAEIYLAIHPKLGYSAPTITDIRCRLSHFGRKFDLTPSHMISQANVEDWLNALGHGPTSRRNYLKILRGYFKYAKTRKWCPFNPTTEIQAIRPPSPSPNVLSIALMTLALQKADPVLRWVLVLGGFCGLRTSEIMRIQGQDLRLDKGHLYIGKLKTQRRGMRDRYVDLLPNAREWVEFLRPPTAGPIVDRTPATMHRNRGPFAKRLGLPTWPHNCLRDSFCSYHLAAFDNAPLTAMQVGHTSAQTTYSHYRKLCERTEGQSWFAITPANSGLTSAPG